MNGTQRPSRARYGQVKSALDLKWRRREPQPGRMMREVVDVLWGAFGGAPWTWCGLWLTAPEGSSFLPGPARPSPAASPVPAEGLLGRALSSGQPCLEGSAIAVPAFDATGRVWAVLEARASTAFDGMDARWLERLLKSFQHLGAEEEE